MKSSIVFGEILISLTYEKENNLFKQIFSFNKRDKFAKYIKDHRYILYNKFEEKIRELSLSIEGTFYFSKRENFDDCVILYYEIKEDFNETEFRPTNFKLVDFIPPNPGCLYCIHKVHKDDNFFFCVYKQKTMTNDLINCKYFRQKRLYRS